VSKHDIIPKRDTKVAESMSREDNSLKEITELHEIADFKPEVYEDRHGLPVIYDTDHQEAKKQIKTETNNITVLWHELISPLTIIKGYAATLLQLNHAISEEQKEQYLKGIDSASNRVIHLLENLRDITTLEETGSLTVQRISMFDLLRQIASEMQNQTTKHIIKLLPCLRLPLVSADPEKLELVVNNLLTNALKYSPDGGDIEISVRLVHTEDELRKLYGDTPPARTPCIITSVADSGVGIPNQELANIFEKFYRVKNKLTRTTPGAGLGLYICKIIVEAHGGNIWAKNRMPNGSAFHFSLPLEKV
jgi:signal transduction histidine kinase